MSLAGMLGPLGMAGASDAVATPERTSATRTGEAPTVEPQEPFLCTTE